MTIRHLTVFMKVCEKMNMTAAGRELFISQPAVSQTISELEAYYKVPLFHRQSGKLHLTGAGEKLRSLSAQLLFWNDEIEKTMQNTKTLPPIKIGGPFSAGENLLTQIISDYDREVGKARLYLHDDCNSEALVQKILSSELDLAFVDGSIHSKDIADFPFLKDELVLLCRADDPILENAAEENGLPAVSWSALEGVRWLLRENGSGSARIFEEIMHKNHFEYDIRGRFHGDDGIRKAVACGLGIGAIAKASRREPQATGFATFRIQGVFFPLDLKIIYHREKHLFPEFKELVQFIRRFERVIE